MSTEWTTPILSSSRLSAFRPVPSRPPSHSSPIDLAATLAQTTYVVLLRVGGKLTLLMDPGMNQPWRGQGVFGKKMGDLHVKECPHTATCVTWSEAWSLLSKEYPGGLKALEDDLLKRLAKSQSISQVSKPKIRA